MRVLICGNYGKGAEEVDGQAIKTRTLKNALVTALGEQAVTTLDTSSVFCKPYSFYVTAQAQLAHCTHVIVLPGRLAIRVLLPLLLHWKRTQRRDLRYVVVGGWLPDLLETSGWLKQLCSQVDGIYVEATSMAQRLKANGLQNVKVLPNFRSFDRHASGIHSDIAGPLKLVFCARIVREKGIEEAISAVDLLCRDYNSSVVSLDVYGPVHGSYEKRFNRLIEASPNATYRGVLSPSRVYDGLREYDLMLFPTYYPGEGFPGTIIDAFVAGVPVLASDWKYNREIIDEGCTGAIFDAKSPEALAKAIVPYIQAPKRLAEMRQHCLRRANDFHVDHALQTLLSDLLSGSAGCGADTRRPVRCD
jgi:glycosyltransferase involved in cell wall biosynthesis